MLRGGFDDALKWGGLGCPRDRRGSGELEARELWPLRAWCLIELVRPPVIDHVCVINDLRPSLVMACGQLKYLCLSAKAQRQRPWAGSCLVGVGARP